jgi:hypothetical protein
MLKQHNNNKPSKMKNILIWVLAIIITLGAAYYQRKTGPTHPARVSVHLNGKTQELKLLRSLGLDERPEVKLHISDSTVKARLFYRRLRTENEYTSVDFKYKSYPVKSFVMNRIFRITEETGLFAKVEQQPPAGKIEYYIELGDSENTYELFKDNPLVIRFKGAVPGFILAPHVVLMFLAMLFSSLAGIMSVFRHSAYKKYSVWTLILLISGGMILGPIVQKYAFGELWTGVPFGWDLTDNKTLIALLFWILAVYMNSKKENPFYTALAALVLLAVYSIPHSMFGSELDYESGKVVQGIILLFPLRNKNIF